MQPPRLHDRSSADLVKEAQALAGLYTPAWTGAKEPGDPGYALIVLAARLVELLAERVNRVPEKNLLAFLDFVGVERPPGMPAEAPVTFLLSARAEQGQQIPAGTQVATTQSEGADAQIFETRNAFFATRAELAYVFNILPSEDVYGALPPLPLPPSPEDVEGSSRSIDVLSASGTGLLPVPHALYLASTALFGRAEPADVTLEFTIANAALAVFDPLHLQWQRFDAQTKQWVDIANVGYTVVPATAAAVVFPSFPGTGKSVVAGREDAWIVARLKTAPSAVPGLPIVGQIVGSVATPQPAHTAPDAALFNQTALDLSKPAFPFGERPRYGDAFHIASSKAFGPEVGTATVQVSLRGYTLAELQAIFGSVAATITTTVEWQYLATGDVWKTLGTVTHLLQVAAVQTTLAAFAQVATPAEKERTLFGNLGGNTSAGITFSVPADMAVGNVGGVSSRWIRAVLRTQAPYGRDGFVTITNNVPKAVGPTFVPPVIETVEITYQYSPFPFSLDRIAVANNFEQGELAPPFFGGGKTLEPFVPLAQYAPGSSPAAAGFLGGDPALYAGFADPFGNGFISLLVAFVEPRGTAQLMPETGNPRIVWEYLAAGMAWKPLDVLDGTSDLTSSGVVAFQSPPDSAPVTLWSLATATRPLYWYRARLQSGSYSTPPRLAAVVPNTVMADNQQTFRGDWLLASGSGERSQQATILRPRVLAGDVWVRENEVPSEPERNELVAELTERLIEEGSVAAPSVADVIDRRGAGTPQKEVWVRWTRVANFRVSGPRSRHYTLEAPTGVVTFGNSEGGLIPPIGKDNIVFRGLRTGGGEAANRLATPLAIKELKTSLPFIDQVFNLSGAVGGTDPWTLEQTFALGPQAIKNRGRAVTVEDYEWVTLAAFGQVARAKALATRAPAAGGALVFRPGAVSIIVVPKGTESTPQPPKGLLRRIETFLRRRAFAAIAADIFALPPAYQEVPIAADVHPRDPTEASLVERRVVRALEAFFHPLTGGERREGWPFGRSVHISEVFAVIERTEGVDYVSRAAFVNGPGLTRLDVGENVLVASGNHQITLV
jgi:hypothetical protein